MIYVAKAYVVANPRFCAHFTADEDRASANYIYVARDLSDLAGGRYAKKRNLFAQFQTLHPDWQAQPLDAGCGDLCRQIQLAIAHEDGIDPDDRIRATPGATLDLYIFGPAERMLANPEQTEFHAQTDTLVTAGVTVTTCIGIAQQIGADVAFRARNLGLESAAIAFPRFANEGAIMISF
ncbi:MAG: hypothetical protein ACK4MS_03430 [Paracoccaceae bacterium]